MSRTAADLKAEVDWRWETLNDFGARGEVAPEWFVNETMAVTAEWQKAAK